MADLDQIGAQISHSIDLQRLANRIGKSADANLDEISDYIVALLNKYEAIDSIKLRNELIKLITEKMSGLLDATTQDIVDQVDEAMREEVKFQFATLRNLVTVKPKSVTYDAVMKLIQQIPMVLNGQSVTWDERIGDYSTRTLKRVKDTITAGWANGLTTNDIAKQISGTKTTKGIISASKVSARAMAHDLISHQSSIAKQKLAQDNSDIIIGEKTIVTLDSRTSPICRRYGSMNNGGKEWIYADIGRKFPRPPFHWNAVLRGEMVTTDNGLVAIENVAVGDLVLTHTGNYKRVTAVMGKKEQVKIKLLIDNFGRSMRLTDEHPVLTQRDGWKRADQILIGDVFFNNTEKLPSRVSDIVSVSSIDKSTLFDSYNIVTEVTEDLVSCGVFSKSRGVTSSIEFNNSVLNEKVRNVDANLELRFEFNPNIDKEIEKCGFVNCKVFPVCSSLGSRCLEFDIKVVHGVFCKHSLSMFFSELIRCFNINSSPMGIPAWCWGEFESAIDRFCSAHSIDSELFSPFSYDVIRESLLSLYHSEGLPKAEMLNLNKSNNFLVGCVSHGDSSWFVSTCTSIVEYTIDDYVFNLSVEDDETYLVNGFLVHNCRSTNIPIIADEYKIDTGDVKRPAVIDGESKQVSETTNWFELAKRYPHMAEQALGPTRAKMLKNMSADEFNKVAYNSLGDELTIDQMIANSKKVAELLKD